MNHTQREFFQILDAFHKLNVGAMVPDVAPGDFHVMKVIAEQENHGMRVSQIAQNMNVPVPAVSRALKSLEGKNLVWREIDSRDRRNTYVMLTEEGKALYEEIQTIMADFASAVFEKVGEETFQELTVYMQKLVAASKEEIEKRKYKKGE